MLVRSVARVDDRLYWHILGRKMGRAAARVADYKRINAHGVKRQHRVF